MKVAKESMIIVCEDVRNEVGGKMSLMGIFHGDMALNDFPSTLPRLDFVLVLRNVTKPLHNIVFHVKPPGDDSTKIVQELPIVYKKGDSGQIVLGAANFKLTKPGTFKIECLFNESEKPDLSYQFEIKAKDKGFQESTPKKPALKKKKAPKKSTAKKVK
jgi:Family of unknown function (DUF6941)